MFWGSIAILPFAFAGLGGWWWFKKSSRPGTIRLGDHRAFGGGGGGGVVDVLASVPYFLIGVTKEAWSWVERKVPFLDGLFTRGTPYRHVPIDDDGEPCGMSDVKRAELTLQRRYSRRMTTSSAVSSIHR